MKLIKDLKEDDKIWRVEQTGDLSKGTLEVTYVEYEVLDIREQDNIIYIRAFNPRLSMGYNIYLPAVEKCMYWIKCQNIWFTDKKAFAERVRKLLREAGDRYSGYLYTDNLSLEHIQDSIQDAFKRQRTCKTYDEYFALLLEENSNLVPVEYHQIKDAIYLHNVMLTNIQKLYNNYLLTHALGDDITKTLREVEEKTKRDLESYPRNSHDPNALC